MIQFLCGVRFIFVNGLPADNAENADKYFATECTDEHRLIQKIICGISEIWGNKRNKLQL